MRQEKEHESSALHRAPILINLPMNLDLKEVQIWKSMTKLDFQSEVSWEVGYAKLVKTMLWSCLRMLQRCCPTSFLAADCPS